METRYQVLQMMDGQWVDNIGESLTREEVTACIGDLLSQGYPVMIREY